MKPFNREQYLEQLRMYYSGDCDNLEQFLQEMSDSLDCYLEEHPHATKEDIYQHFGHPDELQENYEAAQHELRLQKREHTVLLLVASLAVIGILCLGGVFYHSYQQIVDSSGYDAVKFHMSPEDETMPPTETPQSKPIIYYENHGGTKP